MLLLRSDHVAQNFIRSWKPARIESTQPLCAICSAALLSLWWKVFPYINSKPLLQFLFLHSCQALPGIAWLYLLANILAGVGGLLLGPHKAFFSLAPLASLHRGSAPVPQSWWPLHWSCSSLSRSFLCKQVTVYVLFMILNVSFEKLQCSVWVLKYFVESSIISRKNELHSLLVLCATTSNHISQRKHSCEKRRGMGPQT